MAGEAVRAIRIDVTRCQGHARCLEEAPEVFSVTDDTGTAFVLPGANLEANAPAIEMAIAACPECAIAWVEE